jgi:hypothetical protein
MKISLVNTNGKKRCNCVASTYHEDSDHVEAGPTTEDTGLATAENQELLSARTEDGGGPWSVAASPVPDEELSPAHEPLRTPRRSCDTETSSSPSSFLLHHLFRFAAP